MRADGTVAHIRKASEAIVRGQTARLANPPHFVKESVQFAPYPDPRHQASFEAYLIRCGDIPLFATTPCWLANLPGANP